LNGFQVTVFEAKDRLGGMPALAPAFRMPPAALTADINRIKQLGVDFVMNHALQETPEALLQKGFDAVYLACGFPRDASLDIPGIEGAGVYSALEILEEVARGGRPDLGRRVLIIGGGNTAMDAARTARRLSGHPVTVVYRRTYQEMPAEKEEIDELFREGNILEQLATPHRIILTAGRVSGLECLRNKLGSPDAGGRRKPIPLQGSEFILEADTFLIEKGPGGIEIIEVLLGKFHFPGVTLLSCLFFPRV
jgi:putative selenate reductase